MVESTLLPATLAAGVILLMLKLWYKSTSSELPLPPSPRSYPIIGNLLSMPQTFEHLAFEKIGKQLGSDIFSLSVFGTTLVVLNSARAVGDLFEKRSTIYSDRVCPPMLGEPSLLDAGSMIIVVGYNDRWRRYRRMLHPWLQKKATETFYTAQEHQARLLLRRLLDSSHHLGSSRELEGELYRAVAATIFKSVYGYDVKSADDHFMALTKEASDNLGHGILASNFLVNVFPALVHLPGWFPGTNWKKTAHKWRKQKEEAVDGIYNWTKAQIAQGINEPSIIASLLGDSHELGLEDSEVDNDVKYMAFTLITGGLDTSTSTLMTFVLAMILFPEAQKRAQKEIDSLTGGDRLPCIKDAEHLPYVNRLIREVFRWQPAAPLAIPHACYEDDVYRGYQIPKGTPVIGNVWAITRDESVYPDPETFNPDRFLDVSVPSAPGFGWGRRLCPGIHLAQSSIFIIITSILATFDVVSLKGDALPTTDGEKNSIVYRAKPFKCKLVPRSDQARKLAGSTA